MEPLRRTPRTSLAVASPWCRPTVGEGGASTGTVTCSSAAPRRARCGEVPGLPGQVGSNCDRRHDSGLSQWTPTPPGVADGSRVGGAPSPSSRRAARDLISASSHPGTHGRVCSALIYPFSLEQQRKERKRCYVEPAAGSSGGPHLRKTRAKHANTSALAIQYPRFDQTPARLETKGSLLPQANQPLAPCRQEEQKDMT